MDTYLCKILYNTREAIVRAFFPSSWLSKYNKLNDFGVAHIALPYRTTGDYDFGVAHIALPYRTTGDICLSNVFNDNLTDTFPVVRIARNTISAILEALSMRSVIIYFKFRL